MPSASNVKTKSKINETETKKEIGPPSRQAAAPFVEGCLPGRNIATTGHILSPPPPQTARNFLLRVHYVYCPGCGCSHLMHNAINRIGNDLVPRCESCRSQCWRSVGTPFAQAVADRLRAAR